MMIDHRELADTTLELVAGRADAEVFVDAGHSALTRFANSFIHQNVAEDSIEIQLRVATGDGRVASSTSTASTPHDLRRFVDATVDTASQQPVDRDWPGLGGPAEYPVVDHWDDATASSDPMARAEAVRAFVAAGQGLSAAGYCQTEARHQVYANTAGRAASGRYTTAVLDGIHQTGESAGSGHAAGRSLDAIDAHAVGSVASDRARASRDPFDAKPGDYEVVLSPECVATIAVFLDVYGFNAKVSQEDMSFAEVDADQFDPSVTLRDDATDPRALYTAFDMEGTPKLPIDLIRAGTTAALLHTRRTARKASVESTGHASQGAEVWGAFGWNLFVDGGSASVEELIGGVERGIYVSTFNYCRVLDPKSLVVTGLTRNGTFMIENGAITDPVTNLRFTQSFVSALGPGRVLGVGDDARFADSEFGPTFVHTPTMRLASWKFTGGAEG